MNKKRIIIGITGASGAVYGLTLLYSLKKLGTVETHLVISHSSRYIMQQEIGDDAFDRSVSYADYYYDVDDYSAPIASGSYLTDGMIIAPCSAKCLSAIANSYGNNLLTRAADVVLKERRKLVLLFRETPLNLGHIENMARVTRAGGVLLPPVPAFYTKPSSIDDIVLHSTGKALDLFGIEHDLYRRWTGALSPLNLKGEKQHLHKDTKDTK